MAIYSMKMRASRTVGEEKQHISGAEKILREEEMAEQANALLTRALHHAKGKADFINLKIEDVEPEAIEYIDALPVSTMKAASPEDGRAKLLQMLQKIGITKGEAILEKFKYTYAMRGAMLLDADTLEPLEPDHARGIRATYMDAAHTSSRLAMDCKNHFQEAIVLASKVIHAPHIIAELCVSDDPDYVTGYIASRELGYVRITQLKAYGCPDGGRIFLYRGPREDVAACIDYLEKQIVLVRGVPNVKQEGVQNPWQGIQERVDTMKAEHLYRTMLRMDSAQADTVTACGASRLMLASNNYLGLLDEPRVKQAAIQAVEKYGTGSGGSRLTTGNLALHEELEQDLARFKCTETALLFNTGYMANVGILSAFGVKGTVIFSDELNHASIIDGCRLSHAKVVRYRHNDMQDLEEKLRTIAPERGLIVSDAVFSMDGDLANLPDILRLAHKYHVLSMVDEAHATGVIGRTGRGIVEHYGQGENPDLLMGTLSKALGSEGGYVCGSQLLIDYLRNTARSFIYSTSLSPANLGAARAALQILEAEPERVQKLQQNTQYVCTLLRQSGLPAESESAIMPVILGDEGKAVAAAKMLFQQGIILSAIRYPTVKRGSARLRIALMATHTKQDLQDAVKKICDVVKNA